MSRDVILTDEQSREAAKGMLKAELKRHNLTYEHLADRLKRAGVEESEVSIRNKVSRGSFSFAFALQAFAAIGVELVPRKADRPTMALELDSEMMEKVAEMMEKRKALKDDGN